MGETINGFDANVIMPILSFGRLSTNSFITAFTASMRVIGFAALGEKSRADMEPDTSIVRTMSMPLSSRSLYPLPRRGRARAVISRASAIRVNKNLQNPGFALFLPAASFAIATLEKIIEPLLPEAERNRASTGNNRSSHNRFGFAKSKFISRYRLFFPFRFLHPFPQLLRARRWRIFPNRSLYRIGFYPTPKTSSRKRKVPRARPM